jgi:hypothetical protein
MLRGLLVGILGEPSCASGRAYEASWQGCKGDLCQAVPSPGQGRRAVDRPVWESGRGRRRPSKRTGPERTVAQRQGTLGGFVGGGQKGLHGFLPLRHLEACRIREHRLPSRSPAPDQVDLRERTCEKPACRGFISCQWCHACLANRTSMLHTSTKDRTTLDSGSRTASGTMRATC